MTDLAKLNQAHHAGYQEDVPFWLSLAEEYGGPVLELGCGPGRVLLPLARAGYPVVGLDHDPDMLAMLKEGVEKGMAVEVQQADMTDFDLGQKFPLIILPCNTYSTFDESQRLGILDCVKRHLAPGGCFSLSIPNLEGELEVGEEEEVEDDFPHPETGNPVQVSSEWRQEEEQVLVTWHYDHLLPDGQVERVSTSVRHWLTPVEKHRQEFTAAGFSIEVLGGFQGETFSLDAVYMVMKAKLG